MRAYRSLWLFLCGALALVGTAMAFTLPVATVLGVIVCTCLVVGVVTINIVPANSETVPVRTVMSLAAKRSLIGGLTVMTLLGLAALFSAWAFPLVAALVGCSPYALRRYRLWRDQRVWPDPQRRWDPSVDAYAPEVGESPTLESPADLRSLSDSDLCHAWRASYSALQESAQSQRIHIVEGRQRYLDEFERRNREGFVAWLASGARAAANPSRFLMGSAGLCPQPLDWDALIPRQDR